MSNIIQPPVNGTSTEIRKFIEVFQKLKEPILQFITQTEYENILQYSKGLFLEKYDNETYFLPKRIPFQDDNESTTFLSKRIGF